VNRRKFLAAAASLLPAAGLAWPSGGRPKRRVVVARRDRLVTDGGEVDAEGVAELLGRAIAALHGASDPTEALSSIFAGCRKVGIKVNCLGGWGMSTRPELARAACQWIMRAGVAGRDLLVWDRSCREMARAGYELTFAGHGPLVFGTDGRGVGYEREVRDHRSIGSCFSRILTTLCDAQVGMPVGKDHGLCGVTGALKNWFGAIHNPNKWHMNQCNPYIADLNTMPLIRERQRLVVVDLLLAQCHAGPAYHPRYRWAFGGVVVGSDPVVVDAYLTQVVDKRRAQVGLPSLSEEQRFPIYIRTAAQLGLGIDTLENVELIETE
jgi:uncharacterized protein (DUF362 family)